MSESACPDAEALAALAERQASSPQREGLIRHITECHDCYVVYVETVRLLEPVASTAQPGSHSVSVLGAGAPVPSERPVLGRPGHWLIPVAAAVLLAIGMGISQLSRREAAPAAAQKTPPLVRPDEGVTAVEVRRPDATLLRDEPGWIKGAPWNLASQSRIGFAGTPATRRTFLLGMHLAALNRACREPASPTREGAVQEIDRSLRAGALVIAGDRQRLVDQARRKTCLLDSPGGTAAPWLSLGRALEDWRIAAVERNPNAFDPERPRSLARLLAGMELEPPARQLGARLAHPLDGESWDSLGNALVELIELLCV